MSVKSIDIMRYLVAEKGMLLHEERDLPMETLLQNLDSILRVLPADTDNQQTHNETPDVLQNSDMLSDNNAKAPTTINSRISSPSMLETTDPETIPSNEVGTK